jgi:hypothetical protein
MSSAQRRWIKTELLDKGRKVMFQGKLGYCDGERLSERLYGQRGPMSTWTGIGRCMWAGDC